MEYSDKKLIQLKKKESAMKVELSRIKRTVKTLCEKASKLENELEAVNEFNEVYKGVCLYVNNKNPHVSAPNSPRSIHIWQNCNDKSEWRLELKKEMNGFQEFVCYKWYLTKPEAFAIAREWIAFGHIPEGK